MSWLNTLKPGTPEEEFQLALKLSRMVIKFTQRDSEIRTKLRTDYENRAVSPTMASHVVTVNFQTILQANNFWQDLI